MEDVRFAFGHLRWIDPPDHQAPVLLQILKNRARAHEQLWGNEEFCGTILDDDGLPILCAGIYRREDCGLAWTLFHRDMKHEMTFCIRTVRRYMKKFRDLTGLPICVTVDTSVPDAIRWVKVLGFKQGEDGGLWWA